MLGVGQLGNRIFELSLFPAVFSNLLELEPSAFEFLRL